MVLATKQNKPELKVSIDNNPIKQSHHIKYLGVVIDDNLNWKQQIKEQCSKVARGSWALNQLKHFVDEQTLRSVYHCLIYSHLQYCISSWGTASKSTLAGAYLGGRPLGHGPPLWVARIAKLHRKVSKMLNLVLCVLCYTHKTRLSHKNNFFLPRTRTRFGQKSLSYAGIRIWNEIPSSLKEASFYRFEKAVKAHFLSTYETDKS